MNILEKIRQESGVQFLERLNPRPRLVLKDLLPFLDIPKDPKENFSKFQREIIEICGPNDSGKSCKNCFWFIDHNYTIFNGVKLFFYFVTNIWFLNALYTQIVA